MAEDNYENLTEIEFLKKVLATIQKQNSNLENSLPLMRSGHYIDAYFKISGIKESMTNLLSVAGERLQYLIIKGKESENNKN